LQDLHIIMLLHIVRLRMLFLRVSDAVQIRRYVFVSYARAYGYMPELFSFYGLGRLNVHERSV
jgi:hypothetical protein